MNRIVVATSNSGKLRDLAGAASPYGIEIVSLPLFCSLPPVVEDGLTFEENARKKAEAYSVYAHGEIVLADDSGLTVDALNGAPGIHSARYTAEGDPGAESNSDDEANNDRLIRELRDVLSPQRTARFVCVIAAARDGRTLATFRGEVNGIITSHRQGTGGFGYDSLFYFPEIQRTFAQLSAEQKARYSHRGEAFRKFLKWCTSAERGIERLPGEDGVLE
jgi:XTP/dITP diphosphohydrolase